VLWRHIPTCCECAWLAVREGKIVLFCVTFEQQEKHDDGGGGDDDDDDDDDDDIMCLSLLRMTHGLIIKQLQYR